jgi:hypothetical protein
MKKPAKKMPGKMAGLKPGKNPAKAKPTPGFMPFKKKGAKATDEKVAKYAKGGSVARGMGAAKRGGNYSEC